MFTAKDVFEKARDAALAATGPDERALQIDYAALEANFQAALADRQVAMVHINKHLPQGYEDQGHFNLVLLTTGNVLYDMVIGDTYFRYDVTSVANLDKVQVTDGTWEDTENRKEIPFLSLRVEHANETHLLLALNDEERQSLHAFIRAVAEARYPEQ
ncbi:MAG: hypothetical protein GKS05_10000 [Nitrospirales bacterium]|nr:hypothetical protein [Nitrospirales bacterium]